MIEFEISAGLGVLRLNSPPVNAISLALLAKLQNAVRRANQEPEVRAIVITGPPGISAPEPTWPTFRRSGPATTRSACRAPSRKPFRRLKIPKR